MDFFNQCIEPVLEHEGELSIDKTDLGLITRWGISLKFLKDEGIDINADGLVNDKDILGLTKERAKELYWAYFWNRFKYNRIVHIEVAEKLLDMGVNLGSITAHKLLQQALNNFPGYPLEVDGVLGPKTIERANSIDRHRLRVALKDRCRMRYMELIQRNPNLEKYRLGWLRRSEW